MDVQPKRTDPIMLMPPDVGEVVQENKEILLAYVMAIVDAFDPPTVAGPPESMNPFGEES